MIQRSIHIFLATFSHWHLLKGFVVKDIKGRFAASFGGMFWTVLTPAATIIAYFFVFSMVLRVAVTVEETGTDKFVVFFLCGFFPWSMFAESLLKSVGVLVGEASIITKVVFPVELLPISTVFTTFFTHGIGFGLFLVYMAATGNFNVYWLLLPVAVILLLIFALGLAFFLSAICVFIRDIGEVLNIVLMLWFFGTPVIYPLSMAPERFAIIYRLNPMVEYVNFFRNVILLETVTAESLMIMFVSAFATYAAGTWFFVRSKAAFGDVL